MPELIIEPATEVTQGVVPESALAYWQDKIPVSSQQFKAMDDAAKSRAFAVSGLAKSDLLGDLHASIHKAIEDGQTLAQWKASIPDILAQTGWMGHRIETIFYTNVQTAYMAGRYSEMVEVAKTRPYWMYITAGDEDVRPEHAVLHYLVFAWDDPFWDTNYPPNGYRCRCDVVTLSERQARRMGVEVQKGLPHGLMYTDPKTGMEIHVASVMPPSGFASNPGKNWLDGLTPREMPSGVARDLVQNAICKGSGSFASGESCRPALATLAPKHVLPIKAGDILPRGLTESAYALAFLKEFGLTSLNQQKIIQLPGVELPVVISKALFVDKATNALKANKADRGQYLRLLARTIQDPFEIWLVPAEVSGRPTASLRLIRLFANEDQNIGGFGVFSLYGNSWEGNTVFNPMHNRREAMLRYLEKQRVGTLIYREGE